MPMQKWSRRGVEVVNRGEMEEMTDLALELDQRHAFGACAPERVERDQFRRQLIDEHVNRRTLALEQPPDKPLADETRSSRHERANESFLFPWLLI